MPSLKVQLAKLLGEPPIKNDVIVLSPSSVKYDLQMDGGCIVKLLLKKYYGWRQRMNQYVYRGHLIDRAVEFNLSQKVLSGEDRPVEEAVAFIRNLHEKHEANSFSEYKLDDLSEPRKMQSFLEKIEGTIRAIWELAMPGIQPISAQKKHALKLWPNSEASDEVVGYSDFICRDSTGNVVYDFKSLSKLLKPTNQDYMLQLSTYAAAERQSGVEINKVGIYQFTPDGSDWGVLEWDFGDREYNRTIEVYKQYVEMVRNGYGPFPMKGAGPCNLFDCDYYLSCPFGAFTKKWDGPTKLGGFNGVSV